MTNKIIKNIKKFQFYYFILLIICVTITETKADKYKGGLMNHSISKTKYSFGTAIYKSETEHVHSASIVELPNGDLLSVWYQGEKGEKERKNCKNAADFKISDDFKIMASGSENGSSEWNTPFLMFDTPHFPDIDPVLFIDDKNQLWLFFYTLLGDNWKTSLPRYMISTNYSYKEAPTWEKKEVILLHSDYTEEGIGENDSFVSELKKQLNEIKNLSEEETSADEHFQEFSDYIISLAEGSTYRLESPENNFSKKSDVLTKRPLLRRIGWQVTNKPVQINDRIILPAYSDNFSFSIMFITDNYGKSWQSSKPLVSQGAIQPSVVAGSDNSITAYMRDSKKTPKAIYYSKSDNNGEDWSTVKQTGLPNPNSAISINKLSNGHWVLAYNDTKSERNSLAVSISEDEGKTWKYKRHIYVSDSKDYTASFPTIEVGKNNKMHLTYSKKESSEQSIIYFELTEDWIREGDQK